MMYENYPYTLFNPNYLSYNQQSLQQAIEAQRKYMEQQKNIADMVKAISDYFEAGRKVSPEYQQQAFQACLAEVLLQLAKDNGGAQ